MLLLFRYANWSRQKRIYPPITFTKNLQLRTASFTPRRINAIVKMLPYTVHTKPVRTDSWLLKILVSIFYLRLYSYIPPPLPFSCQILSNIFFFKYAFQRRETFHLTCIFTYKFNILVLTYLFQFDHCDQIDFH